MKLDTGIANRYCRSVEEAFAPQSITICLKEDIDVSRGDIIVGLEGMPGMTTDLRAHVCWMNQRKP